jgi:hypothetical protein
MAFSEFIVSVLVAPARCADQDATGENRRNSACRLEDADVLRADVLR